MADRDRIGQQLGNYTLVRLLGRGGQAEVYLGEHRYLKSFAALKVLHASLDDKHSEQFLTEAQTLARLVHPSIVRVLDFTVEQGTAVLIMDYSPSGTMRQRYPPGTCLPLAVVVSVVSQVASALHYAHSNSVIHRDVKPENLLLGPRDEVLLSDFGLSVFAPSPALLSTQAMAGTLPYMAPEQLQGHPCFASDQYSLAIVAYEWLAGTRPFRGSQWQLIQQQLYAAPPSLRERNPSVPAEVEAVVLQALAKDPQERYVSVQGFAQALVQACQAVPSPSENGAGTAPVHPPRAESQGQSSDGSPYSTLRRPSLAPQEHAQETERPHTPAVPFPEHHGKTEQVASRSTDVNRQRLLAKVRAFWITGVLEHSLHGAALIALGLQEQQGAVANPWHLVIESPGEPAQARPSGTSIAQVYDEAIGELLILGEPGSGKTTLLLELARTLLDRAQRDERHPMPILFNLSSWASKQQPLGEWLREELTTKYQVPDKLGRVWIDADQILPLLDGLDEVTPSARAACVEAINIYRLHHGLIPTAVCSRSAEYLAQPVHVLLRKAVVVQPLTEQQIEDYLARAGKPLEEVAAALRDDPALYELAHRPLMLSIFTLAYQNATPADLPMAQTRERVLRQVFATYIERMLKRRGPLKLASHEQTLHWLAFLASQLQQQKQTVFYVEYLQPHWLSDKRRWLYHTSIGLVFGLLGGLTFGLSYALTFGLLSGLTFGLFSGLGFGLLLAQLLAGSQQIRLHEEPMWPWKQLNRLDIGTMLAVVLIEAIIPGLFFWLIGVLVIVLIIVLIVILLGGLPNRELAEHARLKPNQGVWRSARNGLVLGLLGGLGVGLFSGLFIGLLGALLYARLDLVLFFELFMGPIGGLGVGLRVGLDTFLQHFTLRFWLWRTGSLPWNLVAFLDEAAERLLLRKVGGGYIFVHRLLLDYFASLDTTPHSESATKPGQHKDHR